MPPSERLTPAPPPRPQAAAGEIRPGLSTDVHGVNHYAVVALLGEDVVGMAAGCGSSTAAGGGGRRGGTGRAAGPRHRKGPRARAVRRGLRRGIRRIRASIVSDNLPAHALMNVIADRL